METFHRRLHRDRLVVPFKLCVSRSELQRSLKHQHGAWPSPPPQIAAVVTRETGFSEHLLNVAVLPVIGLWLLSFLSLHLWAAIFNPVFPVALIVRGKGGFLKNAVRMVGQLAGAMLGVAAASFAVPEHLQG